jgi:flagellar hook-associated protein 3 FlgL
MTRITTAQIYQNTIQNMDSQQSLLAQLEQEASTGRAIATAADSPLGAAQAVQLSATGTMLAQFSTNQSTATTMLDTESSALGGVTNTLQSVLTQLGALTGPGINDSNRQAAAKALEGLRDQLMSEANSTEADGSFVFSGFQGGTAPFSNASNGGVTYNGDLGTRTLQISNSTSVATADNGASVFMSVLPNIADPVSAGSSANTGTGVIGPVTITTPGAASNNVPYSITFATDPATGNLTYQVSNTSTTPPTAIGTPQPYTGTGTTPQTIDVGGGQTVTISGTPVAGDSFTVTPAAQGNTDVFAAIDSVIAALQNPSDGNPPAMATIENALTTAQTQISNTLTNVQTVQASVGGRAQQVTALQSINQSESLQNQTTLNDLVQTDPSAVLTNLSLAENMLNATEKAFASVAQLSLFSVINP